MNDWPTITFEPISFIIFIILCFALILGIIFSLYPCREPSFDKNFSIAPSTELTSEKQLNNLCNTALDFEIRENNKNGANRYRSISGSGCVDGSKTPYCIVKVG